MKQLPRLVFIDDDVDELTALAAVLRGEYTYEPHRWPLSKPVREVVGDPPAIVVLDMYLPGPAAPDAVSPEELAKQAAKAQEIAKGFKHLYDTDKPGAQLLRETFSHIQAGYDLLREQCDVLDQSPGNGIALLKEVKRAYPRVPVVFYSRKLNVEDAIRGLQAGATSVIRKRASSRDSAPLVLRELQAAQELSKARGRWLGRLARVLLPNTVELVLLKQEFSQQKSEITAVRLGG